MTRAPLNLQKTLNPIQKVEGPAGQHGMVREYLSHAGCVEKVQME